MNDPTLKGTKAYLTGILFTLLCSDGFAWPDGAPGDAHWIVANKPEKNTCSSMDPSLSGTHNGGKQDGGVPFQLTTNKRNVNGKDSVMLRIEKLPDAFGAEDFKGFIIQGVDEGTNKIVGLFDVSDNNENVKAMTCDGRKGSSVTHKSNNLKTFVEVEWTAPNLKNETDVQFYFTVMTDKQKFWARQKAKQVVRVEKSIDEPSAEPETESEPTAEAADAESTLKPEAEPEQQGQGANSIYTGCTGSNPSKGCFGFPSDCVNVKNQNCDMMTTYAFDKETAKLNVELFKKKMTNRGYVAMAFSFDDSMGDDLVFSCTSNDNPVRVGWNEQKNGPNFIPQGISVKEESYSNDNGDFTCRFTLDKIMKFAKPRSSEEVTFDLEEKVFLLLAYGSMSGDTPGYHERKTSSAEKIQLQSTSAVQASADSDLFVQIHGALMVFAWIASASTGMLMARYYKQTWKNLKPLGKDLWFRAHQLFMSLVVTLSIAAFIVIWFEKGFLPYSYEYIRKNPHPATGFASILCACAQPIMAYFRPHPDTSRRWVFDWLHWFVGNSAFLMAICTLFLAVDLGAAKLSGKNIEVALLIFVVVHVIVHLILTFQHCKVTYKRNSTNAYETSHDQSKDMKGSSQRKILAMIYFIFIWIVAISLVIIIFQKAKENQQNLDVQSNKAEVNSPKPEGLSESESASPEAEPVPESEPVPEAEG